MPDLSFVVNQQGILLLDDLEALLQLVQGELLLLQAPCLPYGLQLLEVGSQLLNSLLDLLQLLRTRPTPAPGSPCLALSVDPASRARPGSTRRRALVSSKGVSTAREGPAPGSRSCGPPGTAGTGAATPPSSPPRAHWPGGWARPWQQARRTAPTSCSGLREWRTGGSSVATGSAKLATPPCGHPADASAYASSSHSCIGPATLFLPERERERERSMTPIQP